MLTQHDAANIRSALATTLRRCRKWMAADPAAELRYCGEEAVERMAEDAGVTAGELRQLAARDSCSADLLLKRMAALGLDPNEVSRIEPQVFHDLQRVCTMCEHHWRCAGDIRRDCANPAWKNYCPNVDTLAELNALPWTSRAEW